METDVLIVGGGPSGLFAGFMCGMLDMTAAVLDVGDRLGGQCTYVYPHKNIFDVAGIPSITGQGLVENLVTQMSRFDIKTIMNTTIDKLEKIDGKFVLQTNHGEISAESIVLATGEGAFRYNKPKIRDIEQLEKNGYIKYSMQDLEQFRNKVVIVGGGGDSAVDWCIALKDLSKTHLIHRREKLRAMPGLQVELSRSIDPTNLLLNCELLSIAEHEGRIKLTYSNTSGIHELIADYFIPCYGIHGEKSLLTQIGVNLDMDERIHVNPTTSESSVPGIYAIGDASIYENKRKLIACGFAEAIGAIYHIRETTKPNFVFEYSTSKVKG